MGSVWPERSRMRGPSFNNAWSSFVLALILLAANVGAPFRTCALGRTFLDGRSHQVAVGPRIWVRAIAQADVAHGFRAVVGISGDDTDAIDADASSRPYPAL